MRHTLLSFFLLTFLFSNSKAQFSPAIMLDNNEEYFTSLIKVADFNNDGLNDILTIADKFPLDAVRIYYNQGNNTFIPALIDERSNILTVDVADLNDDLQIDFAIISDVGAETNLSWYENQGESFERHFLGNVEPGMNQVILKDFDNDGMNDILSLEHGHFTLRKATAPGVFSEGENFAEPNEYYAMNANDYNNDGFLDVSIASATGFRIFLNDSGNSFSYFSNSGSFFSFGLESADLDIDGDVDIVSYDSLQGLNLYKNDGTGNFAFHSTILDSTDNFKVFGLVDLNCDEVPDLHTVISQQGIAIWIENQGDGNFNAPGVIHDFGNILYASGNGDLNGDEVPDMIFGRNNLAMALNECGVMNISDLNKVDFQVYPNPFENEINIISEKNSSNFTFQIFDSSGKSVLSNHLLNEVNTSHLPKGIYILNIFNQNGEIVHLQKLLKK